MREGYFRMEISHAISGILTLRVIPISSQKNKVALSPSVSILASMVLFLSPTLW